MTGPYQEKLNKRLKGCRYVIFVPTDKGWTNEERAKKALDYLDQLESGVFEERNLEEYW